MLEANFGEDIHSVSLWFSSSTHSALPSFLKFIPVCVYLCHCRCMCVFHLTYISHIVSTMEKQQWLRLLKLVVGVSAKT